MNPASASLVRARATWPGTCISTTVRGQEEGRGTRNPTPAEGFMLLSSPSSPSLPDPLPGVDCWAPCYRHTNIGGRGRRALPVPGPQPLLTGHGPFGPSPVVSKFKSFHPLRYLEGPAHRDAPETI